MHVTTGDMAGGGTSAGVYIVMVGRGGNSGKVINKMYIRSASPPNLHILAIHNH